MKRSLIGMLCLGAACGSVVKEEAPRGGYDNEVLIAADVGGEVWSSDGAFRIELEADALSADATVRVERLTDGPGVGARVTDLYRVTTTPEAELYGYAWVYFEVPAEWRADAEDGAFGVARRDGEAQFFAEFHASSYDGVASVVEAAVDSLGDFTLVSGAGLYFCLCDTGPGCSQGCEYCDADCDNAGSCPPGEWACDIGHCIPAGYRCDEMADCLDGSDEGDSCEPQGCTASQFTCDDGECIPAYWECDDFTDCAGGEDEGAQCPAPAACTSTQFTCGDGECIPSSWRCDDYDDCADHADEAGCATTPEPTADAYEPDDSAAAAKLIEAGEPQTHSFHSGSDLDFVTFTLSAPASVVVETSGSDTSGDTELTLYDAGAAQLAYDDESGTGNYSRLALALQAGTYVVQVGSWGGQDLASYTLSLSVNP